jgi:predicted component of type VI protein secretion system
MLLVTVIEGRDARSFRVTRFPFVIGRSPEADLRLESPGVWDRHASIEIRNGRFFIQPEGASLLLINGERSEGAVPRAGDDFSLGGARLTVSLAPAAQMSLAAREMMIGSVIFAVALTQILLLSGVR